MKKSKRKIITIILSGIEMVVGLSAVYGSYELMRNGMGMPLSLLENSPFHSFVVPGLLLGFVVAPCFLISSFLVYSQKKYGDVWSAIAGFSLLIWIFAELYLMLVPNLLQVVYFGLGIITLAIVLFMIRLDSPIVQKK